MAKFILKAVLFFIFGMVGGIFADQIFWPYFVEKPLFYQYQLEPGALYLTEVQEITVQENTALKNSIGKVEKAIVGIRAESSLGAVIEGSGLIATSDGLVVTLAEKVPPGWDFSFFVDGKEASYQVLKRDQENNLALIKIEESNLPTVSFADLGQLKPGERVFLVGTFFKLGESSVVPFVPYKIVNEGIVKSFDETYIKTNIFEKPLLSGSALFNIKGEVLGLNDIDGEGKVIAIPISTVKEFMGF